MGTLLVGLVLSGMFLRRAGLERAVQLTSVFDVFLNAVLALAAVTTVWLTWLMWRASARTDGEFAHELEAEPLRKSDPRKIGEFRLLGRVGSGSMGLVYLGRTPTGTFAAVKVIRPELAEEKLFRRRFQRELQAIQDVSGRRFPSLLTSDANAERPWLATEYIPGLPLDQVIKAGPLPLPAVAWLACGIAEALEVIHAQAIVHRDIKPSNVLMDENGPRLIDLGITHAVQQTRLTRTGAIVGTMAFMAPEQASGSTDIGPPADIFALGSLLVYAATGVSPFGESPGHVVLQRVIYGEPDLSGLDGVHNEITALIRACLNKDPAQRPSPSEIIATCRPQANQLADGWLPEAAQKRIARRRTAIESKAATGWPRRFPATARTKTGVAAALVMLLVTGGFWALLRDQLLPLCDGPADSTLRVAASADKSALLIKMAADYGTRATDGSCFEVVVDEVNSGEAEAALRRGWTEADGNRPDVWSPASTEWLAIARNHATRGGHDDAAAVLPERGTASIVTTPLVIAMPEPMARKLGWPDNENIGWRKIAELANDPQGWASYGESWGSFLLGKTNPEYSTSGLNATIGAFYAYPERTDELEEDIDNPAAQKFVAGIEQSIAHYGSHTLEFLNNLRLADDDNKELSYISAVTVEESSMLAYNAGFSSGTSEDGTTNPPESRPHTTLVGIYPSEGTIYSDHPYIEL
ncbi:MAG: serine/threonine protein kinase, partial [Mycobacteriales bacterium]